MLGVKAKFIEPMLLLRTERLPEESGWSYELKHDGYRALAIKSGGRILYQILRWVWLDRSR